jgi:hypothetical protein
VRSRFEERRLSSRAAKKFEFFQARLKRTVSIEQLILQQNPSHRTMRAELIIGSL